mmetsp:Transcript_16854/g.31934  ORF Transcript_16854/g.31934 Transcript_16854/m.31934 type:complete len:90 (+) Transcript_16854:1612-1881(+)
MCRLLASIFTILYKFILPYQVSLLVRLLVKGGEMGWGWPTYPSQSRRARDEEKEVVVLRDGHVCLRLLGIQAALLAGGDRVTNRTLAVP